MPSFWSAIYWAEALPWLGSTKHIWNTVAFRGISTVPVRGFAMPPSTSVEEAEGVSRKMWSLLASTEVATQGVEVTEPRKICMPQPFRVL